MAEAELMLPSAESTFPSWAPVLSASSELSYIFTHLDIDLEEIACLVEEEGVPRDALAGLWIHFANREQDEPYIGGRPFVAAYISKALMQKPEYRDYITRKIPQVLETSMSEYRFLIVNVPFLLQEASEFNVGPEDNIRGAFLHELLHFVKDMKEDGDKIRAGLENGALVNYALIDYNNAEERYVRCREQELMATGAYSAILGASVVLDTSSS